MISFMKVKLTPDHKQWVKGVCLSSDVKPIAGFANGSTLEEFDTGKKCVFDEENSEWIEYGTGEDRSGGGITPTGSINITVNGEYDISEYASAIVAVPDSGEGSGTKVFTISGVNSDPVDKPADLVAFTNGTIFNNDSECTFAAIAHIYRSAVRDSDNEPITDNEATLYLGQARTEEGIPTFTCITPYDQGVDTSYHVMKIGVNPSNFKIFLRAYSRYEFNSDSAQWYLAEDIMQPETTEIHNIEVHWTLTLFDRRSN